MQTGGPLCGLGPFPTLRCRLQGLGVGQRAMLQSRQRVEPGGVHQPVCCLCLIQGRLNDRRQRRAEIPPAVGGVRCRDDAFRQLGAAMWNAFNDDKRQVVRRDTCRIEISDEVLNLGHACALDALHVQRHRLDVARRDIGVKKPIHEDVPWGVGERIRDMPNEALSDRTDVRAGAAAHKTVGDAAREACDAFLRPQLRRDVPLEHGGANLAGPNQRVAVGGG